MPILQAGFDRAPEGASTVVTLSPHNLYRKLSAILKAAGIDQWADLFQTLRQSCETHLVSLGHPQHAVSQWLGHSEKVSKDHYLMVTTDAFSKATTMRTEIADRPTHQVRAKVSARHPTLGENTRPNSTSKSEQMNAPTKRKNAEILGIPASLGQWPGPGLNRRHTDFQSVALPAELPGRENGN